MDVTLALQNVANVAATEFFTPKYIESEPQKHREIEGLGIALAHWTEWDGLALMHIFMSALEDANFHTEAGQVQEMIDRIEMED